MRVRVASGAVLQRLVRARDFLHAEMTSSPTLDDLAREAGLSRAHLARQFAATFGVAPRQYLIQLRLDRAKRALAAGTPVTEVCYELGYESLGTFSANFHRLTGVSLVETVRMASLTPARIAGLGRETGSIEVGKRADLVVLDRELNVTEPDAQARE